MGLATTTATKLLAYDTFLQEPEAVLAGKVAPVGGTWAGAGDAVDFKVIPATHTARRFEKEDANLQTGRYAVLGSEEPTVSKVTAHVNAVKLEGDWLAGVLLRYTNAENCMIAGLTDLAGKIQLRVYRRVGGAFLALSGIAVPGLSFPDAIVSLSADDTGNWKAWAYAPGTTGEPAPLLEGNDSNLATGGTLAKGKAGVYDAYTGVKAAQVRNYDDFQLLAGDPSGVVVYSGKSGELNSQGYERVDSTGTYWGPASQQRGKTFYLQPEGEAGYINRIAIIARRKDVMAEEDGNVEDKHAVVIKARPRYIAPR